MTNGVTAFKNLDRITDLHLEGRIVLYKLVLADPLDTDDESDVDGLFTAEEFERLRETYYGEREFTQLILARPACISCENCPMLDGCDRRIHDKLDVTQRVKNMTAYKLAIGIMSLAGLVVILACGGAGPAAPDDGVSKAQAAAVVKDAVRTHLAFPDDASFGWFPEITTGQSQAGTPIAIVSGKVVAKNAFGGELTYRYQGTVAVENDIYRLALLEINGQPIQADAAFVGRESDRLDAVAAEQAQAAEDAERTRTWTSVDGRFTTEAKFLKFAASHVHLEKADGQIIEVSIGKLSEADREWVKRWQTRH